MALVNSEANPHTYLFRSGDPVVMKLIGTLRNGRVTTDIMIYKTMAYYEHQEGSYHIIIISYARTATLGRHEGVME